MSNKKIIFFESVMHEQNSASITLINLFQKWDKNNLFFIATEDEITKSRKYGFKNFYKLGKKEYVHAFPFNLFSKKDKHNDNIKAQKSVLESKIDVSSNKDKKSVLGLFKIFINRIIVFLNVDLIFHRCVLSQDLEKWILDIKPDYVYATLSSRYSILFMLELHRKTKTPIVVHILDDWPTTIYNKGIFKVFLKRLIDKELIELLSIATIKIGISNQMAIEYKNRYGGDWHYFHNPVLMDEPKKRTLADINQNSPLKIGYFGRIGTANKNTIDILIEVFDKSRSFPQLNFDIYSLEYSNTGRNTFYKPFISQAEMKLVIREYDFLILPISFLNDEALFAKYSMPTKLSDYMASGVPIIMIAPDGIAISNFFKHNNCGFIINSNDKDLIEKELINIFELDKNSIINIINRANEICYNNFSNHIVLDKFNKLF
jgi:glycosyltransferase involved in cell wall biosynthesis